MFGAVLKTLADLVKGYWAFALEDEKRWHEHLARRRHIYDSARKFIQTCLRDNAPDKGALFDFSGVIADASHSLRADSVSYLREIHQAGNILHAFDFEYRCTGGATSQDRVDQRWERWKWMAEQLDVLASEFDQYVHVGRAERKARVRRAQIAKLRKALQPITKRLGSIRVISAPLKAPR